MKKWRRITPLTVAVVLGAMMPITSFGASLSDYDAETQAKLQDNILEYEELQGLIAVYNPTLRIYEDMRQDTIHDMEMTITELDTNVGELNRIAQDMKEAGNTEGYRLYAGMAKGIKDKLLKAYKDGLESANSRASTMSLRSTEYKLTAGAQQIMILYQTTSAQREVAAKAKELAEASYQSTLTQQGLNMVTEADVLNAKNTLAQAESSLAQADAGLLNLKQSLCMLTGWNYDASPDIHQIPEVGKERLEAMNLATDVEKAIGNNQELISQRSSSKSARSLSANEKAKRSRSTSENEQKLRIKMEELYNTVQEKKAEADGAAVAFASAEIKKQGAELNYQIGAVGRLEYLQAEMEFLNQKAAKESADMALLQAVNDYEWGVKGLAEIE